MRARANHGRAQGGNLWRLAMWSMIGLLLLLPLIAMQFTGEVAWTAFDFAVAAALLVGAGAAYEIAARHVVDPAKRAMTGAMILAVVVLVWAQGAVGIF